MNRQLLLIGGGHAHVEVIRRWGLASEPGVAVTLISPGRYTPYSGMLPGYVAGHYGFNDCHIDLDALCLRSGIIRIDGAVDSLDLTHRGAYCGNGAVQRFDIVSIDTGSAPAISGIPGADRHGTPVKPVARLLDQWAALRSAARQSAVSNIVIVGAGAGGIELALAMRYRLDADGSTAKITIVSDGPTIIASHPAGVQRRLARILDRRGVRVRLNAPVQSAQSAGLTLRDGTQLAADHVFWVTGAGAPDWPRAAGLQTDRAGFIAVNNHLQSLSHDYVFAAGDIASMVDTPHPKSGVYAVRQGPPLTENLRRALRQETLLQYQPQNKALALISTGPRHAIASYGMFAFSGAWVWRWKNHIDSAFMRKYNRPDGTATAQAAG